MGKKLGFDESTLEKDGIPVIDHDAGYMRDQIGILPGPPIPASQMFTFAIINHEPYLVLSRRSSKAPAYPGELCPFGGKADYLVVPQGAQEMGTAHLADKHVAAATGTILDMEMPFMTAAREGREEYGVPLSQLYLLTGSESRLLTPTGYLVSLFSSFFDVNTFEKLGKIQSDRHEVAGVYAIKLKDFLSIKPIEQIELYHRDPKIRTSYVSRNEDGQYYIKGRKKDFPARKEDLVGIKRWTYHLQASKGLETVSETESVEPDQPLVFRSGEALRNLLKNINCIDDAGQFNQDKFMHLVKERKADKYTVHSILQLLAKHIGAISNLTGSWMVENQTACKEVVRLAGNLAKTRKISGDPTEAAHHLGNVTLANGTEVKAHVIHAVDAVITDPHGKEVLLIKREKDPGTDRLALPGAFLKPDAGKSPLSGIEAAASVAARRTGIPIDKLKGTLIGKRHTNRPFDVREARSDMPEYGINKGELFMVSTQAVAFSVPDLASYALAEDVERRDVATLDQSVIGIPDHLELIKETLAAKSTSHAAKTSRESTTVVAKRHR